MALDQKQWYFTSKIACEFLTQIWKTFERYKISIVLPNLKKADTWQPNKAGTGSDATMQMNPSLLSLPRNFL